MDTEDKDDAVAWVGSVPCEATQQLRAQAQLFFSQREDMKRELAIQPHARETGYRALEDGREILILRRAKPVGPISAAHALWSSCLAQAKHLLSEVETKLDMPTESLTRFLKDQDPAAEEQPSLLRLIAYPENHAGSAPHHDLGLLTFVVRTKVPALEGYSQRHWRSLETGMDFEQAIAFADRTLAAATNNRIKSLYHRVRPTKRARQAIVMQIRANESAKMVGPWGETVADFVNVQKAQHVSVSGSY